MNHHDRDLLQANSAVMPLQNRKKNDKKIDLAAQICTQNGG